MSRDSGWEVVLQLGSSSLITLTTILYNKRPGLTRFHYYMKAHSWFCLSQDAEEFHLQTVTMVMLLEKALSMEHLLAPPFFWGETGLLWTNFS